MKIIVSDETLRDGEQQVGVNFSAADKFRLAQASAAAGADQIAIMPIVSQSEEKLAKKLLASQYKEKIYASTLLSQQHVDHSYNLGFKNIILFAPVSDRLIHLTKLTKETNLKKAISVCSYAKAKNLHITFAAEDASRAELAYLIQFIKAIENYIDYFIICDTVGILTPEKTSEFIKTLKKKVNCKLGIHFHNDQKLANQNTVAAIKSGAELISGTFGGIGERAGNADICAALLTLKRAHIENTTINYKDLPNIKRLVYKLGGAHPARPYTARAFWHESGIHVHGLLQDPLSYSPFLPEKYGHETKIFFGKFSGVSNYKFIFGEKYSAEKLIKMRDHIKLLSIKNHQSFQKKTVLAYLKKADLL